MARESASQMGSGTIPYVSNIRYGITQSDGSIARGERYGTNVTVINPEDMLSSPYWGVSGTIVAPVEYPTELSQILDERRRRAIEIENIGPGYLHFSHNSGEMSYGNSWVLMPGNSAVAGPHTQKLPLLDNLPVYVMASGDSCFIRWMEY